MRKVLSFCIVILFAGALMAQTTTLTFTGRDADNHFIQINRVVIANATQSWQETIYYPDTVLTIGQVGIDDYELDNGFILWQNNPNPFEGTTYATLRTVELGDVAMVLTDVNGRVVETQNFTSLQPGIHQFRIQVTSTGTFMLVARQNGKIASIKMVNNGNGMANAIERQGTESASSQRKNGTKGHTDNPFTIGDEMVYIGYATVNDTEYTSQIINQNQWVSETFVLSFNITYIDTTDLATVTTSAVNDLTGTSATCGGDVTSDGGATVTARGVCWSTNQNPTISDSHTTNGSGIGSFTSSITDLSENTTYYVRAYATNEIGTAYGNEVEFSTPTYPTVTTSTVSDTTWYSATCGGDVTSDGGATVTARGVCWSTSQNPTTADAHTTDDSGTGSFVSTINNLQEITIYYVRAYATNSVGTAYGEEITLVTPLAGVRCPGMPTVTDFDGNTYNTVQIGTQCWMKENLRTKHYANGTAIPQSNQLSFNTAFWYYPGNDVSNQSTYGLFYNGLAVLGNSFPSSTNPSGIQGICPTGWHVPSDAEWTQLSDYVSCQSQYGCDGSVSHIAKALASTTGWESSTFDTCIVGNTPIINNATGFSALPAGYYYGPCPGFGVNAIFWSTTEYSSTTLYSYLLYYNDAQVDRYPYTKNGGLPVRCLLNNIGGDNNASLPTVITVSAINITTNAATLGGNVTSDGGAMVTARGVCWSTRQNPSIAGSHTTTSSGTGSFALSLTSLSENTTYYVRAYATNSVGTAYGPQVSFTTSNGSGFFCGTSLLTDVDGNTYNTVLIGNQCWMKENLRTKHYANGTAILQGCTGTRLAYWTYANDDISNLSTYGLSYNMTAVLGNSSPSSSNPSGVQGICPTGWHVPSSAEWTQLTDYVSSQSQYWCDGDFRNIAKALASSTGWINSEYQCFVGNDQSTNNATGFSAYPTNGGNAYFWSASEGYGGLLILEMYYNQGCTGLYGGDDYGLSVRCLRDDLGSASNASLPSVTTVSSTNITANAASAGGNVTSDGGAPITVRGVCWSTSQNPTTIDCHTINDCGTGSFTSFITGMSENTTYYLRAYATNCMGTAYGQQVSFTTSVGSAFSCGTSTLTDVDGNVYNTVQIGDQCWMKENLRTTKYADNEIIIARYYPYGNNSVSTHGYMYNWETVMHGSSSSAANPSGVQGICPNGWHIPSNAEWEQLIDYVSSQSQYCCGSDYTYGAPIAKALAATTGWYSSSEPCTVGNDQSANNATGFSALPTSYDVEAGFWSSTNSVCYYLMCGLPCVYSGNYITVDENTSVRCLRNGGIFPYVSIISVSNITSNSAVLSGNVTSDDGATVTARGVCWSTIQNPTTADSHTTDGNGTGSFTSSLNGLNAGTKYYARAYATNSAGTAYGEEVSFITTNFYGLPCSGDSTVTDVDGNVYNTVQIGEQCWMKENLRTTRYEDSTSIALGNGESTTTAYRYYPNNNRYSVATYGYLYNWTAVMHDEYSSWTNPSGVQGICPNGWHVPSDAEWSQLTNFVSSQSQYVCGNDNTYIAKALAATTGWANSVNDTCDVGNDQSANNATGFSVLPTSGDEVAGFWSATNYISPYAYKRELWYNTLHYLIAGNNKYSQGYSVRCLRDNDLPPHVSTISVSNITSNSAVLSGNVTSDGGATVTARGVCWSTSQNPTTADSHTTDGNGTGSFTSSLNGLNAGTKYYARAYATNSAGTVYGQEVSFITTNLHGQPCSGDSTVTDVDGNVYKTVQIGEQCWMKENLRTTRYADSTSIALGNGESTTTAYRYYPNNNRYSVATYGYLYNWTAVMHDEYSSWTNPSGVQGICPNGWHVPSDAEWSQLTNFVSSQSQYVCGSDDSYIAKALAATTDWANAVDTCNVGNDQSTNNATGFSALPAGDYSGGHYHFGHYSFFWSATGAGSTNDYIRYLPYNAACVYSYLTNGYHGYSVRCLRD